MKHLSKIISLTLAVLICLTVICVGSYSVSADTSFTDGDFRFTMVSEDKLLVSGYLGNETDIELPEFGRGKIVTGVYTRSFQNTNLESVVIPRSYTVISAFAFNGCENLASIELPSSLESIGIMAFSGCTSLKSIDFSYTKSLTNISYAAFSGCTSLERVELPDNLKIIGDYAFYNCAALNKVFIPESVTSIGENAFAPMTGNGDIDVICYTGTYAAEYCAENDIKNLVLIDKYIGDTNRDGYVSISDVTAVQRYLASFIAEDELNKAAADVDGDGEVTIYDADYIQRFIAKFPDLYHIGYTSALY